MIIEDEELRELFQQESDEHLQVLEQGLLRLENDPTDQETLDQAFRATHSLKGAAKMVAREFTIERFDMRVKTVAQIHSVTKQPHGLGGCCREPR